MSATGHIKVPASLENLQAITDFIIAAASAAGFPQERKGDIELALEEAVTNVIKYSHPEIPGEIEVSFFSGGRQFRIEIRDSGDPFDITSLPDPELSLGVDERPVGGLGAYLIKKAADAITYRRSSGANILTLIFNA